MLSAFFAAIRKRISRPRAVLHEQEPNRQTEPGPVLQNGLAQDVIHDYGQMLAPVGDQGDPIAPTGDISMVMEMTDDEDDEEEYYDAVPFPGDVTTAPVVLPYEQNNDSEEGPGEAPLEPVDSVVKRSKRPFKERLICDMMDCCDSALAQNSGESSLVPKVFQCPHCAKHSHSLRGLRIHHFRAHRSGAVATKKRFPKPTWTCKWPDCVYACATRSQLVKHICKRHFAITLSKDKLTKAREIESHSEYIQKYCSLID